MRLHPKRTLKFLAEVLLGIVFLILGVFFAVYSYEYTSVSLRGDRWLSATTTITYTYSIRSWTNTKDSGLEYVLYPSYSFIATDGKTYHGNQYDTYSPERTIRKIGSENELKKHLVEEGQIFYDPDNPSQSAVNRPVFILALPIGFGAYAALLLIGGIQILRDTKRLIKKLEE